MTGFGALALYMCASRLMTPLAPWILNRRIRHGKEDPARIAERLGRPGKDRPDGRLVWLHGASVGEGLTMLPLIDAIRVTAPDVGILVTTGTVTSARRMAELLPEGCLHQYAPVDTWGAVRGFLDHWRPDLAIWIESEFWPRLMHETARRGTPMALVNARMSARSARSWRHVRGMARWLLDLFSLVIAQDDETIDRLRALGANPGKLEGGGNLKVAIEPPGCNADMLDAARGVIAGRPVWLAASTHAPEEEIAAEAHRMAMASLPGLMTILAPRHPARGDRIEELLRGYGLNVARRSTGREPNAETDVWLADTLGEMGLWFRLAPVAFIGGSIAPMGGHNPFEPAALGSVIMIGPEVANFAPAYAALEREDGVIRVTGATEIAATLTELLSTENGTRRRKVLSDNARAVRDRSMPDVGALAEQLLRLVKDGRGAP